MKSFIRFGHAVKRCRSEISSARTAVVVAGTDPRQDGVQEPEHVVPRSIFIHKTQSKIIIPACEHCNRAKADGEDDLRDYLIIKVGIHGHPDIFPLMVERMRPAAMYSEDHHGTHGRTAPNLL